MNVEGIVAAIPRRNAAERLEMRANAERWSATGNGDQRAAAVELLRALDAHEESEHNALVERLNATPLAARVVEAFRAQPMSEADAKAVQALLDHPSSTSTELSRFCGWGGMKWHQQFGTLCKSRAVYLWPAPRDEKRDADFYSGILADIDAKNRFTMKPEPTAAFASIGLARKR